jgi:hypothetical protein
MCAESFKFDEFIMLALSLDICPDCHQNIGSTFQLFEFRFLIQIFFLSVTNSVFSLESLFFFGVFGVVFNVCKNLSRNDIKLIQSNFSHFLNVIIAPLYFFVIILCKGFSKLEIKRFYNVFRCLTILSCIMDLTVFGFSP